MTLNDNAVLKIAEGHFYRGEVAATAPADAAGLLSPASPAWTEIGHTSLEDILNWASEGGEVTTLGTLQKKILKTSRAARTETLDFLLQQWDEDSLKLYFGSNMTEIAVDSIWSGVPINPVATASAFLAVFTDGEYAFGVYAAKADLFRGDDLSLEDTEGLSSLPIRVTPLIHSTNTWAYAVTPLVDVTP